MYWLASAALSGLIDGVVLDIDGVNKEIIDLEKEMRQALEEVTDNDDTSETRRLAKCTYLGEKYDARLMARDHLQSREIMLRKDLLSARDHLEAGSFSPTFPYHIFSLDT